MKSQSRGNPDSKWEIFNLAEDEAENKNTADEHPGLIEKFEEIITKRTPSHIPEWNF